MGTGLRCPDGDSFAAICLLADLIEHLHTHSAEVEGGSPGSWKRATSHLGLIPWPPLARASHCVFLFSRAQTDMTRKDIARSCSVEGPYAQWTNSPGGRKRPQGAPSPSCITLDVVRRIGQVGRMSGFDPIGRGATRTKISFPPVEEAKSCIRSSGGAQRSAAVESVDRLGCRVVRMRP